MYYVFCPSTDSQRQQDHRNMGTNQSSGQPIPLLKTKSSTIKLQRRFSPQIEQFNGQWSLNSS